MAVANIEQAEIHYIDQEKDEEETDDSGLPKPGKPRIHMEACNRAKHVASISWKPPSFLYGNEVETYTIRYESLGTKDKGREKNMTPPATGTTTEKVSTTIKLERNKTYIASVKACYEDGQSSKWSDYSDDFTIEECDIDEERPPSPKDMVIKTATPVDRASNPVTYQILLKQTYFSQKGMIRKYEYGKVNPQAREKVIMLVGATGSGKSTLINVMINFWFGIERRSNSRLRLVDEREKADQSESQTKYITAYTIHSEGGMRVSNTTLTIIDTPGFGDTEGAKRDEEITDQIQEFFKLVDESKVNHIDAVGFVTQASLPRLTPTQKYIFERILSVFGNDIKDNIIMLFTFADTQEPQVLCGLEKAGIHFRNYFKFNNSAIFTRNKKGNETIESAFWDMGEESFNNLFSVISTECTPKSLTLSQTVLQLRQQVEANITQIQTSIRIGLNDLERLRQEMEVIKRHEKEIEENKDFEYTVEEDVVTKRPSNTDVRNTNCLRCKVTCHANCTCSKKKGCKAMNLDKNCMFCPKHCASSMHKNTKHTMVLVRRRVTKTYDHLKNRYQDSMQGRSAKMDLMTEIKNEFEAHQDRTLFLAEENRQMVETLNEIALKPNPMSTTDYIDILIIAENSERKNGFASRITELRNLRERAEICAKMLREGHDPFKERRDILEEFENKTLELTKKESILSRTLGRTWGFFKSMKNGLLGESKKKNKGEMVLKTTLVN